MKVICEECRDYVDYKIEEKNVTKTIKGQTIDTIIQEAHCNFCEGLVYVKELADKNLTQLQIDYRKQLSLITIEEIEYILSKYDIGKRPLSILLDWGEVTITRYLDGSIPTKQYSDVLIKLKDNPDEMLSILNKNQSKISELAYKKCLSRIEKMNGKDSVRKSVAEVKIDQIIAYILYLSEDITPLALQKILYYCQGFYKTFAGIELFTDTCEAWIHGPVYPKVYSQYKKNGYNVIEKEIDPNNINLSKLEKELIQQIVNHFGCYSGKVLEKMTHAEQPWRETRLFLDDHVASKEIISKDAIYNYFSEIKKKYNMINLEDIKDYAIDLFSKVHSMV